MGGVAASTCRSCGKAAPAGSVRCPSCHSRLAPLKSPVRRAASDGGPPTKAPTQAPTQARTKAPTKARTKARSKARSKAPTTAPTQAPDDPPPLGLGWWRGADGGWHPPQVGETARAPLLTVPAPPASSTRTSPPRPGLVRLVVLVAVLVVAAGVAAGVHIAHRTTHRTSHPTRIATATTTPPTVPAGPRESAETAMRRLILQEDAGEYSVAWDQLIPLQQALVPRDRYIACQGHSANGVQVRIDTVVRTASETVQVPGTTTSLPSTAITINLTVSLSGQSRPATSTIHEFAVGGLWRWSFDQTQVDAYRKGTCPG